MLSRNTSCSTGVNRMPMTQRMYARYFLLRDWADSTSMAKNETLALATGDKSLSLEPVERKGVGVRDRTADEASARSIAATDPGDEESEPWLDPALSSCIELVPWSLRDPSLCEIKHDGLQTYARRRQLGTETLES